MDTTLVQRDQMRSRIAQLEHEEAVAARDYPRSAFRAERQTELASLRRELSRQLRLAYNGRPESGRKS